MDEFAIIQHYFASHSTRYSDDLDLGIGDDCAVFHLSPEEEMVITTDTLVSGVHFFPDAEPCSIGWKSLAVNISDLAAMGAKPRYFTLALTLPSDIQQQQPDFLPEFSRGLFRLSNQCGIDLIGGDTTHGSLSITITAMGTLPRGKAILRSGAQTGDDIYVTGTLGDAALAVELLKCHKEPPAGCRQKLDYPEPRVAMGMMLQDIATAMLDISDGLGSDLRHILERSGCSAVIDLSLLPLSREVREYARNRCGKIPSPDNNLRSPVNTESDRKQQYHEEQSFIQALFGGDDYELCFTAPPDDGIRNKIQDLSRLLNLKVTRIGRVTGNNKFNDASPGEDDNYKICYQYKNQPFFFKKELSGYNHFS